MEVFLDPSVVREVSRGEDLQAFADDFTGWVPAPPERSREFAYADIQQLLRAMDRNANTAKVIGYKEFPYTAGGKLRGEDRMIEREYWLQLSNVGKRCVGPTWCGTRRAAWGAFLRKVISDLGALVP